MSNGNRWLLPDGVDEILPPQARKLESLRRNILDLYNSWGYDLVVTPLIEFLDSLLIIPSDKLQLRTFKIVDQLTGRSMGVRADLTAQVARIDAHVLKQDGPTRLCYADSVLHTKPSSLLGSRSPIRIGAELYGHKGNASDIEVITLMLESLKIAALDQVQLALGHVGIYRGLIKLADLDTQLERKLFKALQRKDAGTLHEVIKTSNMNDELGNMLTSLITFSGGRDTLKQAKEVLGAAPDETLEAIDELNNLASSIEKRCPNQSLYFDLAELRGYEYHTGVVFAAYIEGYGEALSKGGRYDHIGEVFGRARAATGFDMDLKTLLALSPKSFDTPVKVFAPGDDDPELQIFIDKLRAQGNSVLVELPGQTQGAKEMKCAQQLVKINGIWQCQSVE